MCLDEEKPMTPDITSAIFSALGHVPTADQERAVEVVSRFLSEREDMSVMVLRGAAGTGKTSLAAAIVGSLRRWGMKMVLLAPTGRAAKVFSLYAGSKAFTIHRRIYRQRTAGDLSAFSLAFNSEKNALFIVDEASMIANSGGNSGSSGCNAGNSGGNGGAWADFGSGRLLDDLVSFVYSGTGCRLLLIGDHAQLPPVGQTVSPALSTDVLQQYGLKTFEATLGEVVRQDSASGILTNATIVRAMIESGGAPDGEPQLRLKGFADICRVGGDELIEQIASSFSRVGVDETMVVTRSNRLANVYNRGIRHSVLDREEELSRGDQLVIVKNNYNALPKDSDIGFLANGDRCRVERVRNIRQLYGLRFADAWLSLPDYDDCEIETTVLLDTLLSESAALTAEKQSALYAAVAADYADVAQKGERLRLMKADRHLNALQVKFGYAMTCHKAQGGQWAHVYVDRGYMGAQAADNDYLHWLYTAFTRATEKLFLVNFS